MSDDEKESDSVGPDIDLEKIAAEGGATDGGSTAGDGSTDHDDRSRTDDSHAGGNPAGNDGEESHGHDAHDHDSAPAGRTTAPQSEFTTRQAAIGGLVTAVGVVVAYAIPALLV